MFMDYESCSGRLVMELAIILDPDREGVAVDIGVGDHGFFFADFAEKGFQVIAVEPLPSAGLVTACRAQGIALEVAAMSDNDGHATMYRGQFKGKPSDALSSLDPDWWGSSRTTKEVSSITLATFLEKWKIKKITVLKMDTEGSEATIIDQLRSIPAEMLPKVIQFEYGGGAAKHSQRAGWSPKFFDNTCASIEVLRSLGYEWLLPVDSDLLTVNVLWLPDVVDPAEAFHPQSHVGNAIVCKDNQGVRNLVGNADDICRPHVDYPESLLKRLLRFGSQESAHSFRWILPFVIAQQYETKRRPLRVAEYGPGANSQQFLNSMVCELLVSVEDNLEWYHEYAPQMAAVPDVTVDYALVEVKSAEGKAHAGGHVWTEPEILEYVNHPAGYGENYFDIIFIDSGDRGDPVTVRGRQYLGWPVRNRCLELAHALLNDKGVAIVHDVPGPVAAMIRALDDSIQRFKYVEQFEEFQTTVVSDTLDLVPLRVKLQERYRIHRRRLSRLAPVTGVVARLVARVSHLGGTTWHTKRCLRRWMYALLDLDDAAGREQ